jgi:hypothetical protein
MLPAREEALGQRLSRKSCRVVLIRDILGDIDP